MGAEEFWREHRGVRFSTVKAFLAREYPGISTAGDIPRGESKSAAFCFGRDHTFHVVNLRNGEMTIAERDD